jgi:membrane fusion protein, heavy metal efflux system
MIAPVTHRIRSARTGRLIGLLCVLIVALAPVMVLGQAPAEEEHDHDHEAELSAEAEGHTDEISLTAAEQQEFGIVTAEAGPGSIVQTIKLPGTIHPNDDQLAHLVPRYDGIVTAVHVHVGDQVKKGQALATIESDQSLAPYALKTMIDGTVIEKHITLGEAASRDRAPFLVANLSTVWLDLHIYQRDLHRVRVGQKVRSCGGEAAPCLGEISYISPVVDESTRTSMARVVLDNSRGQWRPGMFVTTEVETGHTEAGVVVPLTAIFSLHEETIVFIADEHGFEARHVETGPDDGTLIQLVSGLEPGETYVSEGGFTLKAELEKSSFGDGHNH